MTNKFSCARARKFFCDETGSTAIEYALIGGLIGLSVIGGSTLIRTQLNVAFAFLATALSAAISAN